MLKTKANRRLACGAVLVVLCVSATLAMKARGPAPYEPDSPDFRRKGDPQAPVVLVEYSDFQCPACAASQPALRLLLKRFGTDLRLIYKHFPWEAFHPKAKTASIHAECAGRQGKFWAYHDLLYDRQEEWVKAADAQAVFARYARELGLDLHVFAECVRDPALRAAVEADRLDGDRRFVSATPTFFVNGKRFVGGRQLSQRGTLEIERLLGSSYR